ncbi:hypothetical protein GCM10029964_055780 [Kibdelosporangium lantanae]
MFAVDAAEDVVRPLLVDGVEIAAVNGPASVVVSGGEAATVALAARFADLGYRTTRLRVSHAFHSALMEPMLAEYGEVAARLSYGDMTIPVVSNANGEIATALSSAEYWVQHVRRPVLFHHGVRTLCDRGVTRFVEVGPGAALSAVIGTAVGEDVVVVPTLRRHRAEPESLLAAVGTLHVHGSSPDWEAVFGGRGARTVDLPTYAFQRQRYWVDAQTGVGGVTLAGLDVAHHPMLGAEVSVPDVTNPVFTGRLSRHGQPWLADHDVHGTVLVPGAGFVELALWAGEQVGAPALEELTLHAPLRLPEQDAVQIRVAVGTPDEDGRRTLRVHSRLEASGDSWALHAVALLSTTGVPVADFPDLTEWPPRGAVEFDVTGTYPGLLDRGYAYGPTFQGLVAAWRRGDEVLAEAELPATLAGSASGYGIHPALLDAALHAVLVSDQRFDGATDTRLPFAWNDVTRYAVGTTRVRVRITRTGNDHSIAIADSAGRPVLTVGLLATRTVSPHQLTSSGSDQLFSVEWRPVTDHHEGPGAWALLGSADNSSNAPAFPTLPDFTRWLADGNPAPELVVAPITGRGDEPTAAAAHRVARQALRLVQEWLAADQLAATRLVIVTRGAVALPDADVSDLAAATVWGLVRAAQAEHPDRFVLVDTDEPDPTHRLLGGVVALDEPELAIRQGTVVVPRLARFTRSPTAPSAVDPQGTVLVTGGTSGLGALLARHLVTAHGARHLVLASRRGGSAPGARALAAELTGSGATVTLVACDVTDRDEVAALLAGIPAAHPLRAVVHAAGVSSNGMITALTENQLDTVLRPKLDGAWHLHELTFDLDLAAFVLVSSIGGLVAAEGQGNYAAGNVFLDALAARRRAAGLPATSVAFGLWDQATGMSTRLDESTRRMRRLGFPTLSTEEGLRLFDAALDARLPLVVATRLDLATLRGRTRQLPALLRELVNRPPTHRQRVAASTTSASSRRLAALAGTERHRVLLDVVRSAVAAVLGYDSPDLVGAHTPFSELGIDSLTAVELRNSLSLRTDLRLPATLVFDHPTPSDVATHIGDLLAGPSDAPAAVLRPPPAGRRTTRS